MDGLSVSDIKSVINDDGDGGFGGGGSMWIIVIVLFLFVFMGKDGGMFGGGNSGGAALNFATNQDVINGFNHQAEMCKLEAIDKDVTCGNFEIEKSMLMGFNGMQAQIAACCCDIKDEIKEQEIQGLRDKLISQEIVSSNMCQTQNILNELGHYATNPPCYPQVQPVYPNYGYPAYGGFGGFDGRRDGFRNDCCC